MKNRFGKRQRLRRKSLQSRGERFTLLCRIKHNWILEAVSAQIVTVVKTANLFDRSLRLIAVIEIERDKSFFQFSHRRAWLDSVFAEVLQRRCANREYPVEFGGGIVAVVPKVRARMSRSQWPCIFIRNEYLPSTIAIR